MTNEERRLALYCLKANSNLHGEICEKCSQYPECDHFIQDNVMEELIEALEQEPCEDKIIEWKKDFKEYINSLSMPRDDYKGIMEYINDVPSVQPKQICEDTISRYGVPHKIAEFFSNWGGDEDAKMEISVNDMREIASIYQGKARIERRFKAMRQEPCEDAISRQAVLEYIEGSEAELGHSSENELVCRDIKEFPPVQPKIKVGHWIDRSKNTATCSCCNRNNILYGDFCKWCGTKMESEDKG